jgi:hypothetical protein
VGLSLAENYITGDDGFYTAQYIDGFPDAQIWLAQSWTATSSKRRKTVSLKLYRAGSPGTVTVSIKATSGGSPSGADLCSGTFNGNSITTDPGGEWVTVTLGDGFIPVIGTVYAIVLRFNTGATILDLVRWRLDSTSPTYPGGLAVRSTNSGSTWTQYAANDFMFKLYTAPLLEGAIDALDAYVEANMAAKITAINAQYGDSLLETPKGYYLGNVPQELPESPSICFQGEDWNPEMQNLYRLQVSNDINIFVYVGDTDPTQRFRKLSRWAQALAEMLNEGEASYGFTHSYRGRVALSDTLRSPSFLQAVMMPVSLKKTESY